MKDLTIAEFRKDIPTELKQLPIRLKRYDEVIAYILSPDEYEKLTSKPEPKPINKFKKKEKEVKGKGAYCTHGLIFCRDCRE